MSTAQARTSDTERMELRSYVQLAGEAIAHYWPMRTFIHHNPLHGLEGLPFDQAVKRGEQLLGGQGYLPNATYRRYFEQGRIRAEDLSDVLASITVEKRVLFGGRELSHLEVLRLSMIHGLAELPREPSKASVPEDDPVHRLTSWLTTALNETQDRFLMPLTPWESVELPTREPLSAWCDRTLGTEIVSTINEQMIKWCSAFLDEGEASWAMPRREAKFYRAWKALAQYDSSLGLLGVKNGPKKIAALEDRSDDALLRSLIIMSIPKLNWEAYLSLHLSALPGWTGFIKWRSNEQYYPWQATYPIDLVKYLAVRLFYERELVALHCEEKLGINGSFDAIRNYMDSAPYGYWLRRELVSGKLSRAAVTQAQAIVRARTRPPQEWEAVGKEIYEETAKLRAQETARTLARQLLALARVTAVTPESILETTPSDVTTLLNWLEGFPPSQQGRRWLQALEARHRHHVVAKLEGAVEQLRATDHHPGVTQRSRPLAQMVHCIDVRSEVFRRHLENRGGYETFGLAGFFGIPLEYQSFGAEHSVTHCPVLLKPKNQIREIPRSYHGETAERHRFAAQLTKAGHALLHDLKENVITPYVMVEALGWFFSLPLFGKTLCPLWYYRVKQWLKEIFLPPLATTLTIDKLTREEAVEIVAAEQRAHIRQILLAEFQLRGSSVTPALIETIRIQVLERHEGQKNGHVAEILGISPAEEDALYERLRQQLNITSRGISSRLARITQNGFSVAEQAYGVEAGLRLMGFTSGFARLVVFCAHGSTSDNNPFESALDCGACGGNNGLPNARAFASMANRPSVRDLLKARGIKIPSDTHFVAAEHDTTCNEVRIVDMEDVPATHRKDLSRLLADLKEAGAQAALEHGVALDGLSAAQQAGVAQMRAQRRSTDWAQVRPEWGLSKNSLLIVGRRDVTRTLDLEGRAFLHSYDHRQDDSGKLLEAIMTAPLVVAQWINMEHYFSTVDNEVYGSGSKVYHNVVSRVGVMSGVSSDLRIGLPAQTVFNGAEPYHEPMRLLTVIEAPRARIRAIILKHPLLERLFDLEWVSLVALDPDDAKLYQYEVMTGWTALHGEGGGADGRTHATSHERN